MKLLIFFDFHNLIKISIPIPLISPIVTAIIFFIHKVENYILFFVQKENFL